VNFNFVLPCSLFPVPESVKLSLSILSTEDPKLFNLKPQNLKSQKPLTSEGASHICKNIEYSVFYLMHPFSLLAFSPKECLLPLASCLKAFNFWVFTCIEMYPSPFPILKKRRRSYLGLAFGNRKSSIYNLPEQLRAAQNIFQSTGGLHAAAIFDGKGELLKLREDVGRHNALDKLIGSALLADELPLSNRIVMVSGRSSYEILQKCLVAGASIICAVSAPSSLAVSLAREFNITLIGFLRGDKFNVYSGIERIDVG